MNEPESSWIEAAVAKIFAEADTDFKNAVPVAEGMRRALREAYEKGRREA